MIGATQRLRQRRAHFAIDHPDQLAELFRSRATPGETTLIARVVTPSLGRCSSCRSKFGTTPEASRGASQPRGGQGFPYWPTFHVGSQCMDPKPMRTL